jgi:hypothetical protein
MIDGTAHYSPVGVVCVMGRNAKSAHIRDINMGSAGRSTGMYDFNSTNRDCYETHIKNVDSKNLPLGIVTGLNTDRLTIGSAVTTTATITPTSNVFHTTGTATVSTITVPYTNSFFSGAITIIPDNPFPLDTAGNIAVSTTTVTGKSMNLQYDNNTSKWYPSY